MSTTGAETLTTCRAAAPANGSRRRVLRSLRLLGAAAVLGVLVWRLGTGPFVEGLRMVDARAVVAAFAIGIVTTVCCAWRWRLVSHGLGVTVPFGTAVAAYYRSQFLNLTLPGGVVGDVHRGVSHGREVGDVSLAVRVVAWERTAGQAVQVVLTVVILLLLPSPARPSMPLLAALVVVLAFGIAFLSRVRPTPDASRWRRALHTVADDLRQGLLSRRAWPGIVLASTIVILGYATTFVIAAKTAGSPASPAELLPLALLVLLAMAISMSIGGWGPREGMAAWAFAMAGLGAAAGVATAVVYGVMVLVASLPGAVVLVLAWRRGATLAAKEAARA